MAVLCPFERKPRMRRFPEPNFSRRAAKTQRRSFWQYPGFSLASLPFYMMPFCKYENDEGQLRTAVLTSLRLWVFAWGIGLGETAHSRLKFGSARRAAPTPGFSIRGDLRESRFAPKHQRTAVATSNFLRGFVPSCEPSHWNPIKIRLSSPRDVV